MGASGVGDQRLPLSPVAAPEPLELLLPPELVAGPPELEPLDPLEPAEPLDAPDPPAFPELAVPEPEPVAPPEPLTPEDPPDPESRALVSSEEAGEKPPPLLPEHPTDNARQPTRGSERARTRASIVVMGGRAPQRSYRASRSAKPRNPGDGPR
jgi:hypothetical protein